ncbi:MAG: alpha-1,2-fucosyltransferase [Synergistaceae bacterium]|nr:alpha-1,2-fucosyltransferase [Synergistaceae bacterium]
MIITHIMHSAGMGNQMFMYAAGLAAASRLKTELKLGTWNFESLTTEGRHYHLGCFPQITEQEASFTETFKITPSTALKNLLIRKPLRRYHLFRRVIRKILNKTARLERGVYMPDYDSWSPEFLKIKDNTFISGYWESEKIFAEISGLVRRKFTFSPECFSPELSAKVQSCNSVAVHVRRGDKAIDNPIHLASNEHYLKIALEKISGLTENPKFFVFSDDIAWCRHNLPKIHEADYSFIEGRTPPQDMALMTICRHVVVGVSTFSWWGAWLNENPGKIIIAPDVRLWYKDGAYNHEDRKYLLPENWITIG